MFTILKLTRFFTNPNPIYIKAVNRVINYLRSTWTLGLKFGGGDKLEITLNTSFTNNTIDRKSSQGYTIQLFGGFITWKINKQDTVIILIIKTELLGLLQTTRKALYLSKLLKELNVTLDNKKVKIQYNDSQTIYLINSELAVFFIKLQHVNIYNY